MTVVLLCGGEISNYNFCKKYLNDYNYIICCDGGIRHAHKLELTPDYIIGDMDSAEPELLARYEKSIMLKYPKEKDHTDSALGLDLAISLKASYIVIMGGTGSRFDHSLANVHLLFEALQKKVNAVLVDECNAIRLVDSEIELLGKEGATVSLISLTPQVEGITTEGLKYPLYGETLRFSSTRGVSNVMLGSRAKVTVQSGLLAVITLY